MLKAVHARDGREAALVRAVRVVAALRAIKLGEAAELVYTAIDETLTYDAFSG